MSVAADDARRRNLANPRRSEMESSCQAVALREFHLRLACSTIVAGEAGKSLPAAHFFASAPAPIPLEVPFSQPVLEGPSGWSSRSPDPKLALDGIFPASILPVT